MLIGSAKTQKIRLVGAGHPHQRAALASHNPAGQDGYLVILEAEVLTFYFFSQNKTRAIETLVLEWGLSLYCAEK